MAGINNKYKSKKQSGNKYPLSNTLRKLPSDCTRKKPSHKDKTALEQGTGGTVGWVLLERYREIPTAKHILADRQ